MAMVVLCASYKTIAAPLQVAEDIGEVSELRGSVDARRRAELLGLTMINTSCLAAALPRCVHHQQIINGAGHCLPHRWLLVSLESD